MQAGARGRLRGTEAVEFFGGLGRGEQESWSRTPSGLHGGRTRGQGLLVLVTAKGAGGPHSNRINMVPIKDVRECSDGRRVRNCCTCQNLCGRCLVSAAVAGSSLARESRLEHYSTGS